MTKPLFFYVSNLGNVHFIVTKYYWMCLAAVQQMFGYRRVFKHYKAVASVLDNIEPDNFSILLENFIQLRLGGIHSESGQHQLAPVARACLICIARARVCAGVSV